MVYNVLCRHCLILILITLRCRWELIPILRWRKKLKLRKGKYLGQEWMLTSSMGLTLKLMLFPLHFTISEH